MTRIPSLFALFLLVLLAGSAHAAANVTRLEVRIATGADGVAAGGYVELRLRELGKGERRLPIARGEAWPAGSTRIVPVTLAEPIDADAIARVGIYYRAANASQPDSWEIAGADVIALRGAERVRLNGATIQGVVLREGELASAERSTATLTCVVDSDCNDGRSCNGIEKCSPGARNADARGCLRGTPVSCPVNQACIEGQGCRGVGEASGGGGVAMSTPATSAARPAPTAPATAGSSAVPVQTCSGRDVLLTDAGGATRLASCPTGTACIAQPNGTGVCVPQR
jgi:hypothetical protein